MHTAQVLIMAATVFRFSIFCFRAIFCALLSILSPGFDPSLNGLDLTRFLVQTFSPRIFPQEPAFGLHHYRTQFRLNMSDPKIMALE